MYSFSRFLTGLLLTALLVIPATAAEDHPVPDDYIYCTVCHGVLFQGNIATRAPKLIGLSAWYVETQLLAFRSGLRGHHAEDLAGLEMRPMAEMLTEDQVSGVSRLVAGLSFAKQEKRHRNPTAGRGQQLFASCSTCHGPEALGNQQLLAPNLVTQDAWYLLTQLNNYRNDIRGTNDNDIPGMQMRSASSTLLSDQDVLDVVAYIKSL